MLKKFSALIVTLLLTLMPMAGVATAETATNLIANPSAEISTDGVNPDSWLAGGWGTNAGALTYEIAEGHTGTRSLKAAITSFTDGAADWFFTPVAVQAGQTYTYSHWYKANVDTEIDVEVAMTDATAAHQYSVLATAPASTAWAQVSGSFTVPAGAASVTMFQVLNKVGSVQIDDASLTLATAAPASTPPTTLANGIVSLTFDDGWMDQYTNGRPVLNNLGLDSTYYLLSETASTPDEFPDYMHQAEMQTLKNEGNEIASHTITHPQLPSLTPAQLTAELADSQTQLRTWFGADVAKNFASPYGEYNATTVAAIKTYYRSHRSTDDGFNSPGSLDIYNIKVQNILDGTTPAQVQAWVDQAIANKTWLVLVYHRVGVDTAEEDYGVSVANLTTELNYIKNSGISVLTVDKALDTIQGITQPPVAKPGDANGDNLVNIKDATLVSLNWGLTGQTRAQGDVSGDGTVNIKDATLVSLNWGK